VTLTNVTLEAGDTVQVVGMAGSNLDLEYTFEKPAPTPEIVQLATAQMNSGVTNENVCSPVGAARTGSVGPFGVSVLGAVGNQEFTSIYFEFVMGADGRWATNFCADYTHSSTLPSVDKQIDGGPVRILDSDTSLTLRIIVDMSIIESFAQGGRAAITTRVYPQVANDANSRVVVFNNGTLPVTLRQLDAYHIEGVSFRTLY
jgi:beta-fructofuranosidase